MNHDMPLLLLLLTFVLGACSKADSVHFGPPVGVNLSVAGVAVEAALAVSSPEEPLPLLPKVAELLSAVLPVCKEAQTVLHAGQVLRFTLRSKQGSIFGADAGKDAAAACLTQAAIGRQVGSLAELSLLIELREKPQ